MPQKFTKADVERVLRGLEVRERDAYILVNSPYDMEANWGTSSAASRLAVSGLLEQNPQQRSVYRVTQFGEAVVDALKRADRAWYDKLYVRTRVPGAAARAPKAVKKPAPARKTPGHTKRPQTRSASR